MALSQSSSQKALSPPRYSCSRCSARSSSTWGGPSEIGGAVVGHACLIEITPRVLSELAIVIHQDWQGRGLGSAMLSVLLEMAHFCEYHRIWLSVETQNRRAISLYLKHGFKFVGPFDTEREMELIILR